MFPQEAESKYKNIIYNWIGSGRYLKRCSPWTKRIRKFEWLSVFIKHKKITSNFKCDLIDSELGKILSVTTEVKTEYSSSALMHSQPQNCDDHVETMDRQDRQNRQIKFLDDGGDCNDCDDHMETGL